MPVPRLYLTTRKGWGIPSYSQLGGSPAGAPFVSGGNWQGNVNRALPSYMMSQVDPGSDAVVSASDSLAAPLELFQTYPSWLFRFKPDGAAHYAQVNINLPVAVWTYKLVGAGAIRSPYNNAGAMPRSLISSYSDFCQNGSRMAVDFPCAYVYRFGYGVVGWLWWNGLVGGQYLPRSGADTNGANPQAEGGGYYSELGSDLSVMDGDILAMELWATSSAATNQYPKSDTTGEMSLTVALRSITFRTTGVLGFGEMRSPQVSVGF